MGQHLANCWFIYYLRKDGNKDNDGGINVASFYFLVAKEWTNFMVQTLTLKGAYHIVAHLLLNVCLFDFMSHDTSVYA